MTARYVVLRLLLLGPSYGYRLAKRAETLRPYHPLGGLNVYPVLKELERDGCVTSEVEVADSRPRRIYSITDRGRERFTEWLNEPQSEPLPSVADPVMLRMMLAPESDFDLSWLPGLIEKLAAEVDAARELFSKFEGTMSAPARIAAESYCESLARRLETLREIDEKKSLRSPTNSS